MDDSRRPATATAAAASTTVGSRSSGIPRLSTASSSRLPVPQPRSSTSNVHTSTALPSRRLRSTPSRDQLSSNNISATSTSGLTTGWGASTRRKAPPPGSSQGVLQDPQPRIRSRSIPRDLPQISRRRSISRSQCQAIDSSKSITTTFTTSAPAGRGNFKRLPLPKPRARRRPSDQIAPTTERLLEQEDNGVRGDRYGDDDDDGNDDDGENLMESTPSKTSQTSLSERTIETLSQLPSSPAVKRRASNFFDANASRRSQSQSQPPSQSRPASRDSRPASRPGSSYHSDSAHATMPSRPGSSSGQDNINFFRASAHTPKATPLPTVQGTPTRRVSTSTSTLVTSRSSLVKMPSRSSLSASVGPGSPRTSQLEVKPSFKSLAARPLRSRASVGGLFKQSTEGRTSPEFAIRSHPPRKKSLILAKSSTNSSGEERNPSSASTASTTITVDSFEDAPDPTSRKSSAALREQITKAKAAKRATSRQPSTMIPDVPETPVVPTDPTFDFGLFDDPFGQKKFESSNHNVMQSRTETARTTGRLNISAMVLKEIPDLVLKMYDLDSIGGYDGSWAESVDLTRFVAADNELETIEDTIFPDTDPADFANDEDGSGHQFAGLESLDLHNNSLIALPVGLRRLHFLTSLNLAHNKLTNNCLETISQVTSLRDLKLGYNLLYGAMDECFSKLENLEILDIQNNNISALPKGLNNLSRLRILNLNENAFASLPFGILSVLPLTDLQARKNDLSSTLINDPSVNYLPHLQTLDVSNNRLSLLAPVAQPLDLPSLHQLSVSMNRLRSLPNMASWTCLLTLAADENSITTFPDGLTSLSVRSIDFGSNDISILPPEIGQMESLAMLRISGNPLREKKFASLTTESLKAALAARLEPSTSEDMSSTERSSARSGEAESAGGKHLPAGCEDYDDSRSEYDDDFATPPTSAPHSPERTRAWSASTQTWPLKAGGVLDRSKTQSSSLHPVICSRVAASHGIREVWLQHNTFTIIPESLSFFGDTLTTLCVSHNQLVGESYFTGDVLDLTALKELNLSSNHITSLIPLTSQLRAPNLEKLDVSFNRIVTLPVLRDFFPSLTVLQVSDNHLEQLEPEWIEGMKLVDVRNNDITHLNPRIGLLGGSGGLERLDVKGNRFRVPRWNVLERGTEATLRWLRGRVPVAEMAEWRTKSGETEEEGNFNDFD